MAKRLVETSVRFVQINREVSIPIAIISRPCVGMARSWIPALASLIEDLASSGMLEKDPCPYAQVNSGGPRESTKTPGGIITQGIQLLYGRGRNCGRASDRFLRQRMASCPRIVRSSPMTSMPPSFMPWHRRAQGSRRPPWSVPMRLIRKGGRAVQELFA